MQIVELNAKDQSDIITMLYHHDVGDGDDGMINAKRVAQLCAADWGLWRTTKMNTERTREALAGASTAADVRTTVEPRLERLWEAIEAAPKSARWKMRNRVGDKVRWYEEPEEVG